MLAAPIVALVDPGLIPGTLIMIATLVTLIVVIREREDIDLHGHRAGRSSAGCPAPSRGRCCWRRCRTARLAILLAGVVLVGVVLTSCGWIPAARRRNVVLAGATSGVLGTATSIGGPPMALVWQRNSGARLRGTMSGFFLIGSVMSLVCLASPVRSTAHTLRAFAVLIPAAMAGYAAVAATSTGFLDPERLRWLAIGVSARAPSC